MEQIQRLPRGLANVIGSYGGLLPKVFEDSVHGSLEMLQFFGLQQLQNQFVQNAAVASGADVSLTVPANQYWLLYHCFSRLVEQAAMTFADQMIFMDPGTSVVASIFGNPGFTAGRIDRLPFVPPYPMLLLPGNRIGTACTFAGVATADLSFSAVVGVLG